MKPPTTKSRFNAKFFWVAILVLLFVLTVVWFIDPLGKMEESRRTEPFANPTEWAVKPTGPAVEVTLPTTAVTMVPAPQPEAAN